MKHYLIVDCMSDYKEIMDIKGIKELLIEEVTQDIYNNPDERDVVEGNVKILKSLALDSMTLKGMEEELECYSFKIIDLLDLQRDLEDVKGYFLDKERYVGNICETICEINKEVNNNG